MEPIYTVTYKKNDGTNNTYLEEQVDKNTYVVFKHWLSSDGGYVPGTIYTSNRDLTLKAYWETRQDLGISSVRLPTDLVREGYELKGWGLSPDTPPS
jgi:hypothetical protein